MIETEHERAKRKPLMPHWYFIYYDDCVLCGRGYERRER
ncbi:hypothetical protein LCGC14_3168430, partial [marine sediment metagenome]